MEVQSLVQNATINCAQQQNGYSARTKPDSRNTKISNEYSLSRNETSSTKNPAYVSFTTAREIIFIHIEPIKRHCTLSSLPSSSLFENYCLLIIQSQGGLIQFVRYQEDQEPYKKYNCFSQAAQKKQKPMRMETIQEHSQQSQSSYISKQGTPLSEFLQSTPTIVPERIVKCIVDDSNTIEHYFYCYLLTENGILITITADQLQNKLAVHIKRLILIPPSSHIYSPLLMVNNICRLRCDRLLVSDGRSISMAIIGQKQKKDNILLYLLFQLGSLCKVEWVTVGSNKVWMVLERQEETQYGPKYSMEPYQLTSDPSQGFDLKQSKNGHKQYQTDRESFKSNTITIKPLLPSLFPQQSKINCELSSMAIIGSLRRLMCLRVDGSVEIYSIQEYTSQDQGCQLVAVSKELSLRRMSLILLYAYQLRQQIPPPIRQLSPSKNANQSHRPTSLSPLTISAISVGCNHASFTINDKPYYFSNLRDGPFKNSHKTNKLNYSIKRTQRHIQSAQWLPIYDRRVLIGGNKIWVLNQ